MHDWVLVGRSVAAYRAHKPGPSSAVVKNASGCSLPQFEQLTRSMSKVSGQRCNGPRAASNWLLTPGPRTCSGTGPTSTVAVPVSDVNGALMHATYKALAYAEEPVHRDEYHAASSLHYRSESQ